MVYKIECYAYLPDIYIYIYIFHFEWRSDPDPDFFFGCAGSKEKNWILIPGLKTAWNIKKWVKSIKYAPVGYTLKTLRGGVGLRLCFSWEKVYLKGVGGEMIEMHNIYFWM